MAHPVDPAASIAEWSDRIRELAALGLRYAENSYDRERYQELRELSMQMLSVATQVPTTSFEPLRETHFSRPCPLVTGDGAVVDNAGRILLIQRSDSGLWALPGGLMGVGESPAEGVEREVLEETGHACRAVTLTGIYYSQLWEQRPTHDAYRLAFLCRPTGNEQVVPSHAHETLDVNWFAEHEIPQALAEGHQKRIADAYRVWHGNVRAYIDETGFETAASSHRT